MWKKILLWLLATIITLGTSVYQRKTGPTNPLPVEVNIGGQTVRFRLPRSGSSTSDKSVVVPGLPEGCTMALRWREYPSNQTYSTALATPGAVRNPHSGDSLRGLVAKLPAQPPAGKLDYYVEIAEADSSTVHRAPKEQPVVIRFKGDVPAWQLIPHIIGMFLSMLFCLYAALSAALGLNGYGKWLIVGTSLLVVGGFVFGPLVQHAAFGQFWSGFPVGTDITDNKTLVGLVALLAACGSLRTKWHRVATVLAVVLMMVIFSIPHSVGGSELNRQTGQVETSRGR